MKKSKVLVSILFILLITVEIVLLMWPFEPMDNLMFRLSIFLITLLTVPEIEIWHFILYCITRKKNNRTYKTFFNIISFILSIGVLIFNLPMHMICNIIGDLKLQETVWLALFGIYLVIKFIYFIVWAIKEA